MTVSIKHCPLECSCRWLTPFDRRLLRLLAHGHTNGEIARYTQRAQSTVKSRLVRIYKLLDTPSRTETVLRAQVLGLVDLPDPSRQQSPGDPHIPGDHCLEYDA